MGQFGQLKWERLSSLETALHQFDQPGPSIGCFFHHKVAYLQNTNRGSIRKKDDF